ncbi:MAG: hypothetical protein ABW019_12255 [Chitinophagaceae bacterium]
MPENEFEKAVQQRMEELRLPPAPSVWLRVEEELKKKRKRRIGFFFLLLVGLTLLGYSGYLLSGHHRAPVQAGQKEVVAKPVADTTTIHVPTDHTKQDIAIKNDTPVAGTAAADQKTPAQTTATNGAVIQGSRQLLPAGPSPTNRVVSAVPRKAYSATSSPAVAPVQQQPVPVPVNTPVTTGADGRQDSPVITAMQDMPAAGKPDTLVLATVADRPDTTAFTAAIGRQPDSLAEKNTDPLAAIQKKKDSKLRFGIDLSAGITTSRNNLFSLQTPAYSADFPYSSPSSSTGGSTPIAPPSLIRAGPSVRIGGLAELSLSRRSRMAAGLRYTYLSEKIKVGNYRDTAVLSNSYLGNSISLTGIYRGPQSKPHTNRYHFIELPIWYRLRLGNGKLPLTWNAGLSAGYLLGTNALVYDTAAGGIYVHNLKALRRFQASVNTGFSLRFGRQGGLEWSVGPEFSMALTQLVRQEPFIKKRYLLYGGISVRLLWPPIKK